MDNAFFVDRTPFCWTEVHPVWLLAVILNVLCPKRIAYVRTESVFIKRGSILCRQNQLCWDKTHSWRREIWDLSCPIAPKFDRCLGCSATETPVKFQSNMIISTPNLAVSRPHWDLLVRRLTYINQAFSALLVLCAVTGGFPSQNQVTWSFDVFFDLRLNKRLSKQSRRWWFQTSSRSLWRQCNAV